MVRLVPIEKQPIPMVLLVIMHLIKGTPMTAIGTNGTIGTNRKPPYSNGSVGEYTSEPLD